MINICITQEELNHHNKSKKPSPTRVCISKVSHKKLRKFAADNDVSMQAVVECFVEKLTEEE